MKKKFPFILCMIVALFCSTGCVSDHTMGNHEKKPDFNSIQIPIGYESVKLTNEQQNEIMEAAKKIGLKTVYIPLFLHKGMKLEELQIHNDQHPKMIGLFFKEENRDNYIIIKESPTEVLKGGVVVNEKDVILQNGIKAKWIAFSNHKDNIKGASSDLYFKIGDTYLYVSNNSSDFHSDVESIAVNLYPLEK
jgi:hypothetical protein